MNKNADTFPWHLVVLFIILKLLIHFLTNTNYELHRDALLYIAQSDHLSWGYISVPPFTAFLIKLFRTFFGDSVFALRLLPALTGGLCILYISLMVRQLGGKSWALILANTAFLFSVSYLRTNTLLQPVALDIFFWLAAFYYMLRLVKSGNPRYWIHLAVVFGLGFLVKYSIVFLALGFFISLLLTSHRQLIMNRNFLFSLVIGLILISPNLIWQYLHNWPVLYHMELLSQYQLVNVTLSGFLIAQLIMNLNGILTWLTGLGFLLFHPALKKYRVFGITWLIVVLILVLASGKHYYTLGLYPMLFAFGGYAFEQHIRSKPILYFNLVFSILIALPILPIGLPVLSHHQMLNYSRTLIDAGLDMPMRWEDGRVHPLPQDYSDMIGWKELADVVEEAWYGLPAGERKYTYIYGDNYGHAGAIHFYGGKAGLPSPVCFNGSFIFWAPENVDDLKHLIYVNYHTDDLEPVFGEIRKVGEITNPHARESGLPVFLCSDPSPVFYELYRQRHQEEKSRFMRK